MALMCQNYSINCIFLIHKSQNIARDLLPTRTSPLARRSVFWTQQAAYQKNWAPFSRPRFKARGHTGSLPLGETSLAYHPSSKLAGSIHFSTNMLVVPVHYKYDTIKKI